MKSGLPSQFILLKVSQKRGYASIRACTINQTNMVSVRTKLFRFRGVLFGSMCSILPINCLHDKAHLVLLPFLSSAGKVDSYATAHYTPACFEGVGPLSEDGVLDPILSEYAALDHCQHRDGSMHPGTGVMHCLYSDKSR